jgi:transcriptional regulator with XRE-family HTH domain
MQRLKDWLSKTHTSQQAFAESVNVKQATVWDWLNGITSPPFDKLDAIRKQTGIPLEKLVEDCKANIERRRAAASRPPRTSKARQSRTTA